jgi:hypothetical protein
MYPTLLFIFIDILGLKIWYLDALQYMQVSRPILGMEYSLIICIL